MKLKDLTGQKFGRLTVLEYAGYHITASNKKYVQWKCLCDCGTICYITGKQLHSGKTKSCGCLKREKTIERNKTTANNLINQKFGKLTVLYKVENKKVPGNYAVWHCKCDCGNEIDVASTYLIRGHTQSCGCLSKEKNLEKIKDLTGQHFGRLTPIRPTEKRAGTSVIWLCKCDCGNECYVASSNLIRHSTQSCGCLTDSVGEEIIANILLSHNIKFERQKTFLNCKFIDTNMLAKFDFYLPDYNCLIEYDGIQHYEPRCFGGCTIEQANENFQKTQEHDKYKNQWCEQNNITLIRIPYTEKNKITILKLLPKGDNNNG